MTKNNIKLLDCTLRDGGYINDWKWGFHKAKDIIEMLVKANVDVIEVGFLRNVENYDSDITVCNYIEELNRLLPENKGNTMFAAMAMRSNYDISKLSPYSGKGIELIRITAHDYDIEEGMEFACKAQEKGYKVSINPINIMGYSDEKILWILEQVNKIHPYQFSIVDTFGSMKRRDLDRIVSLVDNNLHSDIRVALHLHENMSLGCSLAQLFIDKHLARPVAVDASLLGMGRIPGNLPIELIADYLNDYTECTYGIDYMMDAIQEYISPIKTQKEWGYTPAYFLSAKYNLHRNYAEHYLCKGDLTNRDINQILSQYDRRKATVFDEEYADCMYEEYKNRIVDDTETILKLKSELEDRNILIIAPGTTILTFKEKILDFIKENKPIIIAVNFVPEEYQADYVFFGNNKRISKYDKIQNKLIVTSNICSNTEAYIINYKRLMVASELGCNSYVMLLKLLMDMQIQKVFVAGADGYEKDVKSYYKSSIQSNKKCGMEYNQGMLQVIEKLDIEVEYLTPSLYRK